MKLLQSGYVQSATDTKKHIYIRGDRKRLRQEMKIEWKIDRRERGESSGKKQRALTNREHPTEKPGNLKVPYIH